jgi:AraC-like DNA-binding protein
MNSVQTRKMRYEDVPVDSAASFTFREFRWPRFPFNWHYHPEVELTLILKGCGLRFAGDSVEQFKNGDLCLFGSNLPHTWASSPRAPRGVCSLVIQFLPDHWGAAFWNLPELRPARALLAQATQGLAVTGATREAIADAIRGMHQRPAGSWQRLENLVSLLDRLAASGDYRTLASSTYVPIANPRADKRLGQILGFIHANLGHELTQEQAARAVGLSPQAFSRFFKRALGKTFVDYVNELKIRNVCRDLLETDQAITQIAYAAGFNNLSHFNEQFRRLKQMTPREYRLRVRAGASHEPLTSASDWAGALR